MTKIKLDYIRVAVNSVDKEKKAENAPTQTRFRTIGVV